MKQKLFLIVVGLSAMMLAGCADNTGTATSSLSMVVSNGAVVAKPMVVGVSAAPASPVTFSDGTTTFTITEARMNIRDIRFDTINSDTVTGDRYTIAGPYVMNLLDGTALPANISFAAPAGNYQRVDIRLDESNIEDGILADTDELLTNAFIIKGTHDYNGVTDGTFTLVVKVTEDIRFEPTNGIVIDTDAGADVVLNYNVTDWLEDPAALGTMIDLTSCIAANGLMDAQNHIALDEATQCSGISASVGNLIKDNMKNKYDFSS